MNPNRQLIDAQTRLVIVPKIRSASSILEKGIGLIGQKPLRKGEGLWLDPCRGGIHTMGLKYPIDVVCFNREFEVVKITANLAPNRIFPPIPGGQIIMELSAGEAERVGLKVGRRCLLS